jgi:cytoskeletal protein CcmA (bactofilin family)
VVLTGHIDVPQGDTVSDAVIFNGDVHIEGTATGNVVAFNGDVVIDGSVDGDVVAFSGGVTVTAGAHVGGNVTSQLQPSVAPGTVSGEVRHASNFQYKDVKFKWIGRFVVWLIATCSTFLLGLVLALAMPRAADALDETGRKRMGACFGFGALWFFAIPAAAGILLFTVLAGLIGLSVLLALLLLYTVAYTIGAYVFGRRLLTRSGRFVSFLAGWGILRVVALVPGLGGVAWFAVVLLGLGAFTLTAWRAARREPESPAAAPAPVSDGATPPLPPMPA